MTKRDHYYAFGSIERAACRNGKPCYKWVPGYVRVISEHVDEYPPMTRREAQQRSRDCGHVARFHESRKEACLHAFMSDVRTWPENATASEARTRAPQHPKVGLGHCPVCHHWGDDCTGTAK